MNSIKTSKTKDLKADIVVIGGGGAGLAAAVAAAEKGVNNIIVLEARRAPGGNAVFPVGIFAAESRLQKRLGIDARKDDLFKKAMNHAHWKTNPRLVRSLIDKSGDTIQWLEEKGVEFVQVPTFYPNQMPPTFHLTSGRRNTGAAVVKALVKNCQDLGVQMLCGTKAKRLLTGEKGKIIGVLAEAKDNDIRITTKAVIIATGGFAGNNALIRKYLPTYNEDEIQHAGIPHNGDGLLMATEIGAATEGMAILEIAGPAFPWSSQLACIIRRPTTIWVNRKGERFTDETVIFPSIAANTVFRQPAKTSYTLFDEKIKQSMMEEPLTLLEERVTGNRSWPAGVDKDLRLQVDKGRVKISSSWDDIAEWIGVAPEVLKSTVDEYNSFCNRGHDKIFAKNRRYLLPLCTPPYYAIQCCMNLLTTHGGIKINHHMEALNQQDSPISGLYAAGNDTGGVDSDTYDIVNLTGHSFGFVINGGRIAGESAAKYVFEND